MTPIWEIPARAFGSRGKRLRPPRRKLSSTPSSSILSTGKTFDSKRLGARLTAVFRFTTAKSRLFAGGGIGPEQLDLGRLFGERLQRLVRHRGVVDLEVDVEPVLPRSVRHRTRVEPGQVDAALRKGSQRGDQAARLVRSDERKRGFGQAGWAGSCDRPAVDDQEARLVGIVVLDALGQDLQPVAAGRSAAAGRGRAPRPTPPAAPPRPRRGATRYSARAGRPPAAPPPE